jgi:hypothetical protein
MVGTRRPDTTLGGRLACETGEIAFNCRQFSGVVAVSDRLGRIESGGAGLGGEPGRRDVGKSEHRFDG